MWEGKIDKVTFCGVKKLKIWLHYYGCSKMVSMIVFVLYSTFCFKIDRLEWYLVQSSKLVIDIYIYIYIYIERERERERGPNFANKIINNLVLHIIINIFHNFLMWQTVSGEKIVSSCNNDRQSITVSHVRKLWRNVRKNV